MMLIMRSQCDVHISVEHNVEQCSFTAVQYHAQHPRGGIRGSREAQVRAADGQSNAGKCICMTSLTKHLQPLL